MALDARVGHMGTYRMLRLPPPPRAAPLPRVLGSVVGRTVLVPRSVYPRYPCAEHGGAGWEATILSATGRTAVVRYVLAATLQGRRYEDARIPLRLPA